MTAEMPLTGRTALVTGAGRRLGRATALALAKAGADVVVHYRTSAGEAESAAVEIRRLGRKAWCVRADLADAEQAAGLLPRAAELAGRPIDILVNSASVFPRGRLMTFAPADLAAVVQVNATAPLLLARALAAQKVAGDVVNFLDARVAGRDLAHVPYHLSKRMLQDLTAMLALELAPGVKVNAVAPGLVLPPPGRGEEYLVRLHGTNPLGRHGSAGDITDAVLLLVCSSFITGQVIFVDGGRHLTGAAHGR